MKVQSHANHRPQDTDGVRFRIVSSRHGVLQSAVLNNNGQALNVETVEVQPGDTLDFVADIGPGKKESPPSEPQKADVKPDQAKKPDPSNDAFEWTIHIRDVSSPQPEADPLKSWSSEADFTQPKQLSPLEQLAQVLLLSNEVMFVD